MFTISIQDKFQFSDVGSGGWELPYLLKLGLKSANMTITPITDTQARRELQRTFDDNSNTGAGNNNNNNNDSPFDLLEFCDVSVSAKNLTVNVRDLPSDLIRVDSVIVSGSVVASLLSSPITTNTQVVTLDTKQVTIKIPSSLPKVFLSMSVHCDDVKASFEPYIVFALQECAGVCARLWPPHISLSMRWWDALRSVINCKLHVTIENTVVRLIAPEETIEMALGFLRINFFKQSIAVVGAGVTVNLQVSLAQSRELTTRRLRGYTKNCHSEQYL